MHQFLLCYPFSSSEVRLVEGYSEYEGHLKDPKGKVHRGIDYVSRGEKEGEFLPFDVYAMHDGMAFQGWSDMWGNYVVVYHDSIDGVLYRTVYAHLDDIPDSIAQHERPNGGGKVVRNYEGTSVCAEAYLGKAGTSGATNGLNQLHIELHDVTHMSEDEKNPGPTKRDPYGSCDVASAVTASGESAYPQPGKSLSHLSHAWTTHNPPLALAS